MSLFLCKSWVGKIFNSYHLLSSKIIKVFTFFCSQPTSSQLNKNKMVDDDLKDKEENVFCNPSKTNASLSLPSSKKRHHPPNSYNEPTPVVVVWVMNHRFFIISLILIGIIGILGCLFLSMVSIGYTTRYCFGGKINNG